MLLDKFTQIRLFTTTVNSGQAATLSTKAMRCKKTTCLPLGLYKQRQAYQLIRRPVISHHVFIRRLKRGSTTVGGFKKQLFNQVMSRGDMLYPAFNRRKHKHSYCLVVNNQHIKLSKAFSYLSKNKIAFYIGSALKVANRLLKVPKGSKTTRKRPVPSLASVVETETALLLMRSQQHFTLRESRQSINHGWWRPRTLRCIAFGDTHKKLKSGSTSSTSPLRHGRWVNHGSVLRML